MRIVEENKLDFKDVLIKPKRSTICSRKEAILEREFKFLHSSRKWKGIPIIASNMDHTGTVAMSIALREFNMLTALCKFTEWPEDFRVGIDLEKHVNNIIKTVGLDDDYIEIDNRGEAFKFFCIDVANGYTERFIDYISKIRDHFEDKIIIIAGNICTPEATEQIILAGADIVKIGIGPGCVCTTRKMTGIGYPQLSAVIECGDAAHGLGGHIIADGGCKEVGDIAKAFGGGADFVMLGGMLSGHKECFGEVNNGFMELYGMSSDVAQMKYYGEKHSYRASEGTSVKVPFKGHVHDTIEEILGGLRSTLTYAGAKTIKDLPKCTTFVKIN
tara:strand:+ start:1290 stop:2279 length:990 start_codon:yes stop_codon:yes gene_type:complete